MNKDKPKKRFGFYRKSRESNRRLIDIFERNQEVRYAYMFKDWKSKENKAVIEQLMRKEKEARKEIKKMLKKGEIKTADDFYRAAWFFHHGRSFRDYALAVALAATSHHLGEHWGKNFYAVTLDRFLLFIGQPQYFGTQFEKKYGKWRISLYNKKTTDRERKEYSVEPLKKTLERVKELKLREKTEK